jgi:protein TonB
MRTVEKDFAVVEPTESYDEVYTIGEVRVEKKEVKVKKKVQPKKQEEPKVLDNIKKQEDDVKDLVEDLTSDSEPDDTKMVEPGSVTEVEEPVEPETVPFVAIETVPLFPGCEGLSDNDERRDCMSANISKFVSKKFRAERGEGLGLEGVNRIYVNFKIDKFGKVVEGKATAQTQSYLNLSILKFT